ncbi:hypothetical protein ACH4TE_35445 [Streptomyces sioyaensis]|uniref:hypothetical protein n=1 Tax=Streptomyces sioyaensis TaxID=67364 RepID=UPI0037AE5D2E
MAEDPIAQSEISALTRRFEQGQETADREFGIVKSDLTAVRLQVGNLDQKVGGLDEKVSQLAEDVSAVNGRLDALAGEVPTGNARILELLSQLVGKNPDASQLTIASNAKGCPDLIFRSGQPSWWGDQVAGAGRRTDAGAASWSAVKCRRAPDSGQE